MLDSIRLISDTVFYFLYVKDLQIPLAIAHYLSFILIK